jgi:hypothetical protein
MYTQKVSLGAQAKETRVERPLGDLLEWLRLAGTALKRKMPAWSKRYGKT